MGCNLTSFYSRGTAEFRYFDSTLESDQVYAYVDVCMAIMRNARARRLIRIRAYPYGTGIGLRDEANAGMRSVLRRGLDVTRTNRVMAYAYGTAG